MTRFHMGYFYCHGFPYSVRISIMKYKQRNKDITRNIQSGMCFSVSEELTYDAQRPRVPFILKDDKLNWIGRRLNFLSRIQFLPVYGTCGV